MNIIVKEIAYLAIRLLAVYIFISTLSGFTTISSYFPLRSMYPTLEVSWFMWIGVVFPIIINLIISIILWCAARRLVKLFVYNNHADSLETDGQNMGLFDLKVTAFTVVGLILTAVTIPQIGYVIPQFSQFSQFEYFNLKQKLDVIFAVVSIFTKLFIGMILLLKSKDIVRLLNI